MKFPLDHYITRFSKLKTDKANWLDSPETRHQAPHKPLLLLALLDRFAEGAITSNFIELNESLMDLFAGYWSLVMPPSRRGNIAMPFRHLDSDKFWHLSTRSGQPIREKPQSVARLKELIYGATVDEDLYQLLCEERSRDALRDVLIKGYFVEEIGSELLNQGQVNRQAYHYSVKLVEQARQRLTELSPTAEAEPAVRDQGFRLAVRQAYDYRCAMTGLRLITDSGHIAVVGAHIVPWSVSRNDNPTNGIALSPTCHWAFDVGLLTVTDDYKVKASPQLAKGQNSPHHLAELAGVRILLPKEESLQPDRESLRWHCREVFRGR
jgi:putative restriction endonuclease